MLRRLLRLIEEVRRTPFEGTGKPESLRRNLSGFWSRRIDDEHRLAYGARRRTDSHPGPLPLRRVIAAVAGHRGVWRQAHLRLLRRAGGHVRVGAPARNGPAPAPSRSTTRPTRDRSSGTPLRPRPTTRSPRRTAWPAWAALSAAERTAIVLAALGGLDPLSGSAAAHPHCLHRERMPSAQCPATKEAWAERLRLGGVMTMTATWPGVRGPGRPAGSRVLRAFRHVDADLALADDADAVRPRDTVSSSARTAHAAGCRAAAGPRSPEVAAAGRAEDAAWPSARKRLRARRAPS